LDDGTAGKGIGRIHGAFHQRSTRAIKAKAIIHSVIALNKGDAKLLGTAFGKNEDAEAKKLADSAKP
jgi:hypothetical protein